VAAGLASLYLGKPGPSRRIDVALLAAIVVLGWLAGREPGSIEVRWSPYQKLVLSPSREDALEWPGKYLMTVNNTGYQAIIDLSERSVRSRPDVYHPKLRGLSQYDIPLLLHPKPTSVLIVGAGTGNDVAGALRNGAETVTAVEIDPVIISQGRRFHPERPYDSPRVRVVVDDARSFFATSRERFDLIVFGLLDSHTTTAMTNARLDHYVYTHESIQRARSLLDEGGLMVMSFEAQKPYIADRLARLLREVSSEEPICFRVPGSSYGWGGVMFVAGDRATAARQIATNARLGAWIEAWQREGPVPLTYTTRITTDDWPYLYLETARIPVLYHVLAVLLVLLFVRCNRRLRTAIRITAWSRWHWHFFFLGAAFLLLEVQNISKASVVLGNTWWVNAVVISGILSMILLANWTAVSLPRLPLGPVYVALVGTCVGLYFLDVSRFAFLPYVTKAMLVGTLTTLPMLFGGILFIRSFAATTQKDTALGANVMGALVGALLQSVTFLTGVKALLLVVAGLYAAALVSVGPRPPGEQNGGG
jgi:SAM-dependent methyltransferase